MTFMYPPTTIRSADAVKKNTGWLETELLCACQGNICALWGQMVLVGGGPQDTHMKECEVNLLLE